MFTVKSLVWLRWPRALVWFYWFDWVKRCRVWFSWVSVLYTSVDSGSSMSCMSWLNVLTRLADCLSWPSVCYDCVDQLFDQLFDLNILRKYVAHDWVELKLWTKHIVWLNWPELIDKVYHMIELTWMYWQIALHDWVDLDLLTKYSAWLAWPEGVNKVGDDIERLPFPDQPLIMVASLCPGKPSA